LAGRCRTIATTQHPRGLDRKLLRTLAASEWVRQNQNVLFIGPTGIGKSWLACALAHRACRDGFSVLHKRTTELFRELAVAHVDGSIGRVLLKLSRVDVLVLDDFACVWQVFSAHFGSLIWPTLSN
jgi:DNA replication protein DnaC